MSDDGSDTSIAWNVGLLDLPSELLMEILLALYNQQSVVALRLTCRQLEDVYQRIADKVRVDQRERIVAPVRKFVEFLDRSKLPEGSISHPPPGGWPQIKPGAGNGFEQKTAFAVDILRHLSYVWQPRPFDQYDGCIGHRSTMVSYQSSDRYESDESIHRDGDEWYEAMYMDGPVPSDPRHILTLSEGWEGPGHSILIDTYTGIVYEQEEETGVCAPMVLAIDFFEDRIKSLKRFDEVFIPGENTIFRRRKHYEINDPRVYGEGWDYEDRFVDYGPDDDPYDAEEMERQGEYDGTGEEFGCMEDADWVRHLYFKHGWPGENWDKEACLQAIREFVDRRRQRSGHW